MLKIFNFKKMLALFLVILFSLTGCGVPILAPTATIAPTAIPTKAPGQTRADAYGIEQVWVPAGSFLMGSSDAMISDLKERRLLLGEFAGEQPQHEVRLTQGYWIDKYEVTNQAFMAFANAGGYQTQSYWSEAGWEWLQNQPFDPLPRLCLGNIPKNPALCLTWYEAEAYANWRGGRLPTEAEWEYAARGPQALLYPWGNEIDDEVRCNLVGFKYPTEVGSLPKCVSWIGVYDMAGNAMEWVQDWYVKNYYKDNFKAGPIDDPVGAVTGSWKIEKGGWWGSDMFVGHSASHHYDPPDYGDTDIGFRIVKP